MLTLDRDAFTPAIRSLWTFGGTMRTVKIIAIFLASWIVGCATRKRGRSFILTYFWKGHCPRRWGHLILLIFFLGAHINEPLFPFSYEPFLATYS